MAKYSFIMICLSILHYQLVTSQYVRQQLINLPETIIDQSLIPPQYIRQQIINRPETIIEPINRQLPSSIITDCNNIPIPPVIPSASITRQLPSSIISDCNISPPLQSPVIPSSVIPSSPSTIIITDCTPSSCQNLANTLQLMIVCNLLQNTVGVRDYALQIAGPVINQLLSSPVLSCGCPNPIASNLGLVSPLSGPKCPNYPNNANLIPASSAPSCPCSACSNSLLSNVYSYA